MIGYLFLSIALLAGVFRGYCGKKISGEIVTLADSLLANSGRMLACIVIGFLFTVIQEGFTALTVSSTVLWISLLSGVCSALFVISWLFAVKESAYMMVEVFLLLGTTIPITLSFIFFNEEIRLIQGIGFIILFIAVYIMSTYNTSLKGKMSAKSLIPLVIAGITNGTADFSQKMFSRLGQGASASAFNLYTCIFAAAVIIIFYIAISLKNAKSEQNKGNFKILRHIYIYILIMALCLFINSYFKTLAAVHIPSTQLYPLNQSASVILSVLMSSIFFKEKINVKCILCICLAFVALLFINLL